MHVFALARRVAGLDVAALSDDSWLRWSAGEGSEWPTQNLSSLPVRLDGAREILIFHMLGCRVLRVFIVKKMVGEMVFRVDCYTRRGSFPTVQNKAVLYLTHHLWVPDTNTNTICHTICATREYEYE